MHFVNHKCLLSVLILYWNTINAACCPDDWAGLWNDTSTAALFTAYVLQLFHSRIVEVPMYTVPLSTSDSTIIHTIWQVETGKSQHIILISCLLFLLFRDVLSR